MPCRDVSHNNLEGDVTAIVDAFSAMSRSNNFSTSYKYVAIGWLYSECS